MENNASIKIVQGPDVGKVYNLTEFPVGIGSDLENFVQLPGNSISPYNLRIKRKGNLYILEDIETKHKCYINNKEVVNSILKSGDQITIGDFKLLFQAPFAVEIARSSLEHIPIHFDSEVSTDQKKTKFTKVSSHKRMSLSQQQVAILLNFLRDLIKTRSLASGAQLTCSVFKMIEPAIESAAVFLLEANSHRLVPVYSKKFSKSKTPIVIQEKGLSRAIALKRGVMCSRREAKTHSHSTFLPMAHGGAPILAFQCNSMNARDPSKSSQVFQEIVALAAPHFQTIILQSEWEELLLGVMETIVAMIEAKDAYTIGHSERVCLYAQVIAEELKLDLETTRILMISARFHDIGKVGIPDAILKKGILLNAEEFEEMKLHPVIGSGILSPLPLFEKIVPGIAHHHERWNGTGYPDGLSGEDIPFFARIIALADSYDAMISGRPYVGFMTAADAVKKLKNESELFDPHVFKAFLRAWDSGKITQRTDTIRKKTKPNEGRTS
ncbi:MAG: HD domain-containing protein [Deltaproteobacteria bacterium]|nr:HD domain-containing protein [Deltaproteobacteria bacterium]